MGNILAKIASQPLSRPKYSQGYTGQNPTNLQGYGCDPAYLTGKSI
ncbi:hypothetical protein FOCG_17865 [Fusarium oxysporum f. sp. radicis-lycopersici 26381]|uniref:Uncharacterized protein n=1 Tax=Fusarium oxysporum NRRL 32931 TaxID=660029 RepID=W9HG29_FUSOX|nr:hypothetical protein FOYG_16891 [Fusarium oxysporum NRRL 32931]EWZ78486.1 hypothetical protein FOWG_17274 [Fusarium oxysporum f. sp. lycopersici MN25]EXL39534.1 hypothetical protein FOCG_17865 [Fusarium oxysporum f. sp. radicis-lycopersici 26381]